MTETQWYNKMKLALEIDHRLQLERSTKEYLDSDGFVEEINAAVVAAGYPPFTEEDFGTMSRLTFRAQREVCAEQFGVDINELRMGRVDTSRVDETDWHREVYLEALRLLAQHPEAHQP